MEAHQVVETLGLTRHPREGGWFKETYRSQDFIDATALPARYGANRVCSTQILYLITNEQYSRFHRVKSDEIFHFYLGQPAKLCVLSPDGQMQQLVLGNDITRGECLQAIVPAGHWQGVFPINENSWSLLGATVSPGFEYADFDEPERSVLLEKYPQHEELVIKLTYAQ